MKIALGAMLASLVLITSSALGQAAKPEAIIFDTDMDSDCDDVGALAMLHVLADRGEAEILATMVSSRNEWSPACVDAINTFYGRGDLPIGCPQKGGATKPSKYARAIAERFPQDVGPADKVPDAMTGLPPSPRRPARWQRRHRHRRLPDEPGRPAAACRPRATRRAAPSW